MPCSIRKYAVFTLSELIKKKIQIKDLGSRVRMQVRIKLGYFLYLNLPLYTRVNKENNIQPTQASISFSHILCSRSLKPNCYSP